MLYREPILRFCEEEGMRLINEGPHQPTYQILLHTGSAGRAKIYPVNEGEGVKQAHEW